MIDFTYLRPRHLGLLLGLLFLSMFSSGCIKEDLDDCPQYLTFDIRALNADGVDISSKGDIEDGIMFVFDENGSKRAEYKISKNTIINRVKTEIMPPINAKDLQFVFYGNATPEMTASLQNVKTLNDLKYRLKSSGGVAEEAPDLFYGQLKHPVKYGDVENVQNITVDVRRITAMVHVKVIGMKTFLDRQLQEAGKGAYDPNRAAFELASTHDTYQGLAQLAGDMVKYLPGRKFDTSGEVMISDRVFRIYPTLDNKPINLNITYDGKTYLSAHQTMDGSKQFIPVVGKTLNILLEIKTNIDIRVAVADWNVVYQFVEY